MALLTLVPAALTPGLGPLAAVAIPLVFIAVSLGLVGVWLLSRLPAVRAMQARRRTKADPCNLYQIEGDPGQASRRSFCVSP